MIYNFVQFIKENSKNSPIPELYQSNKLGIIMLGLPGSGKSTFAREVILPINRNIKIFSTDDVSLKFTKDVKKYYTGACEYVYGYSYQFDVGFYPIRVFESRKEMMDELFGNPTI